MTYRLKVFFLFVLLTVSAFAKEAYKPIPGAIPLQYGGYPASDLVVDGKVLLPEEANDYYLEKNKATRGKWTLAELNPEENSVWKNVLGAPLVENQDELLIKDELDEVSFTSYAMNKLGNYRFTVSKDHSFYIAVMGTKVHNYLLRKNLLRKLGYSVAPVKYLKSLKVQFKSERERDDFLTDFQDYVGRDRDRWITSAPKGETYFYAQDLIIMEDQNTVTNLSSGILDSSMMEGKRIYNSLLVPYALTDIPESVNMYSWANGRIFSENVLLPYEYKEVFNCSNDDAVWMAKRIMALTEQDWIEIVDKAHLPEPVAALLIEKLKSNRNHFGSLFKLKPKKLAVNSDYTDQDGYVKNGKLEKEFFEGYGRRFKIPDPDSPLSYGEMKSFVTSKVMSQGIEMLVSAFNSNVPYLSNDIEDKIKTINNEVATKAEAKLNEGKPLKGLVDGYILPTVSGKLILGRDIVAGSYLGTDNMIQLVDTIGISVSAGAYGGVAGVFAKTGEYSPALGGASYLPVSISGTGNLSITRNYAHVKPITSVKKALKYPFKNMLIPWLKRKQGQTLESQTKMDFDKINAMAKSERDKEYNKIFETISQELEVGESLIITDSINMNASAEAGLSLYGVVNVRGKLGGSSYVLSRLHILRKSQSVVQVYRDLGQNNSAEITMALEKFIPILKVSTKGSKGSAKTKFFNVSLIPGESNFKQKLGALASVFMHNSTEVLAREQKPYIVSHSFTEKNPAAGALIFRYNNMNSVDNITVKAPNGDQKNYIRRYKGYTTGIDFESFGMDLVGLLISKITGSQFSAGALSSSNAGFSFMGKAFNKIQIFEGEMMDDKKTFKPYTRLTRIWNGWQTKKKKAIKILEDIKERYKFNFMPSEVLAQTKKLFLYNINVNLFVHKEGIASLVKINEKEIKEIWKRHQTRDMTNYTGDDVLVNSGVDSFLGWRKKYLKLMEKNDVKKASDYLLKMVAKVEQKLSVDGYAEIFGGKENFLIRASIEGFRIGDENGDQPLVSSSFGMVGNDNMNGPTADMLEFFRQTGSESMTEGEFYVNWLIGRLI